MSTELVFPSSARLAEIAQDLLPRLQEGRPIFSLMPIVNVEESLVIWEQTDRFKGLQQLRGLGGAPTRVQKVGLRRFLMEPGVYGDWSELDETLLTRRRQIGQFAAPIDLTDLTMQAQQQLLQRRLDRQEKIGWDVLGGTFSVAGGVGQALLHTDSYPVQTFATVVPWSNHATSTPLADFRAVALKHRGHSVDFGAPAQAFLNKTTVNDMLSNTNPDDLYGRRTQGLGTYNSLAQVNQLLAGDNLPTIVEYDEGYMDGPDEDHLTYYPFLNDGEVKLVGKRPMGQTVAQYQMTRNVNNPNFAPGAYMAVIPKNLDSTGPFRVEIHDGHNGGPAILYPSAVVVMDVTHTGA